jgi:hypothetical protein
MLRILAIVHYLYVPKNVIDTAPMYTFRLSKCLEIANPQVDTACIPNLFLLIRSYLESDLLFDGGLSHGNRFDFESPRKKSFFHSR